jgi:hypothetical protein
MFLTIGVISSASKRIHHPQNTAHARCRAARHNQMNRSLRPSPLTDSPLHAGSKRQDRIRRVTTKLLCFRLSCCAAMYFAMQQCADKLAVDVVCAVPAVFRWPLRHVEMSAMIHQMNRLGVARRVDDPEGLRRGRLVAPLPRRGTDAGGSWSAIWSGDRAPDTAHVTTKLLSSGSCARFHVLMRLEITSRGVPWSNMPA